MKLRIALAASAALFVAAPAYANLISNGTFQSDCNSDTFCTYYAPDSTDITDWTVSSGSVDLVTGYWQAPPLGGNSVDLDGNSPGSLTSTTEFATVSGAEYVVTFYLSGNPDGGPAIKSLEVSADGTMQEYTYDTETEGNTHSDMKYVLESFEFVADSSMATLGFASLDTDTPYGPVIGDIDAEVPEPMSLGLLGSGLFAAGWFGRRRKRPVAG